MMAFKQLNYRCREDVWNFFPDARSQHQGVFSLCIVWHFRRRTFSQSIVQHFAQKHEISETLSRHLIHYFLYQRWCCFSRRRSFPSGIVESNYFFSLLFLWHQTGQLQRANLSCKRKKLADKRYTLVLFGLVFRKWTSNIEKFIRIESRGLLKKPWS